ncbi:MAG: hypothetical protein M3N13_07900 [Candidatus Eremiobacteraeota bacterium]|nr:hypothetical protein [Candidatus Eremiobacteraeota bacterium]
MPTSAKNERGGGSLAWVTDALLCASSYAPMFAALALRFACVQWLCWTCVTFAIVGVSATLFLLQILPRYGGREFFVVGTVDDRGSDVAGYVATYLLPLVVVGTPTMGDVIAYAIVLAVMSLIYLRSGMVQINPMFYVFGYRLFAVSHSNGVRRYVLMRSAPRIGEKLRVVQHGKIMITVAKIDGEDTEA